MRERRKRLWRDVRWQRANVVQLPGQRQDVSERLVLRRHFHGVGDVQRGWSLPSGDDEHLRAVHMRRDGVRLCVQHERGLCFWHLLQRRRLRREADGGCDVYER